MKEHSISLFSVKKKLNKTSKQDVFEFFCTLECNWFLQAHLLNLDYVVLVISTVCGFLHIYYTVSSAKEMSTETGFILPPRLSSQTR